MHGLPCGCGECGMLAACAAMCDCGASKWSVRSCYVCCVLLHWCMCTAAFTYDQAACTDMPVKEMELVLLVEVGVDG